MEKEPINVKKEETEIFTLDESLINLNALHYKTPIEKPVNLKPRCNSDEPMAITLLGNQIKFGGLFEQTEVCYTWKELFVGQGIHTETTDQYRRETQNGLGSALVFSVALEQETRPGKDDKEKEHCILFQQGLASAFQLEPDEHLVGLKSVIGNNETIFCHFWTNIYVYFPDDHLRAKVSDMDLTQPTQDLSWYASKPTPHFTQEDPKQGSLHHLTQPLPKKFFTHLF
jgi:hypothetical protein